jgi:hypothetical protein
MEINTARGRPLQQQLQRAPLPPTAFETFKIKKMKGTAAAAYTRRIPKIIDMQQQQWKSINAKLGSALAPHGLDVCAPLQLAWYNAVVPTHLHLAAPSEQRSDVQTLAILVGNSNALWSPFLAALRKRQWHPLKDAAGNVEQSGCGHCQGTPGLRGWDKHPVDAYVVSAKTCSFIACVHVLSDC